MNLKVNLNKNLNKNEIKINIKINIKLKQSCKCMFWWANPWPWLVHCLGPGQLKNKARHGAAVGRHCAAQDQTAVTQDLGMHNYGSNVSGNFLLEPKKLMQQINVVCDVMLTFKFLLVLGVLFPTNSTGVSRVLQHGP